MQFIGKMLSAVALAGFVIPSLAQAGPASWFTPAPRLVQEINQTYGTRFAVPAPRVAARDARPAHRLVEAQNTVR